MTHTLQRPPAVLARLHLRRVVREALLAADECRKCGDVEAVSEIETLASVADRRLVRLGRVEHLSLTGNRPGLEGGHERGRRALGPAADVADVGDW
jgi:hypothetical protein